MVPWPAVEKNSQARVTRLQSLEEREHAGSVDAGEERVVLALPVDHADCVELFASVICFRYCGFASCKPASREVRREDEAALVHTKRGSPLALGAEDFVPRFFLNATTSRGELL